MDDNKGYVEEMIQGKEWRGYQTDVVLELEFLSSESEIVHSQQSGLLWKDVQRMTRLASSVKKIWLKAQLEGDFQRLDPNRLNSVKECHLKLNLLRFDHWSPTEPTKFLHAVISK